jgi:hypothetical protein
LRDRWLSFVCLRRKIELVFRNGRHGSATVKGVHFVPEYPIEIYTNITDKLRKVIMSPLDGLDI